MATQALGHLFRKTAQAADNGEILVPLVRNYLWDPKFKSFPLTMPDFSKRPPDGWFHPSEHPSWGERALYYYLQASAEEVPWQPEQFDPSSVMAVTQGHFWHKFIETVLLDAGYLSAAEVPVRDETTGSQGHMDGLGGLGTPEVFEFKTMGRNKASKIEEGRPDDPLVLASFKKSNPGYYAQGQEYLRLSGYRRWRCLILTLEYPYPMREIVMDYDPWTTKEIEDKYLRVRSAFENREPPMYCCHLGSPASKVCPARGTCLMGKTL